MNAKRKTPPWLDTFGVEAREKKFESKWNRYKDYSPNPVSKEEFYQKFVVEGSTMTRIVVEDRKR